MSTDNHKLTPWKEYRAGGTTYRIRAKYGFTKFEGQDPYWSVTGEIQRKAKNDWWMEDSSGRVHGEIAKRFPELAPAIRWHLCGVPSGPMHYEANGLYWWEHYTGARLVDRCSMGQHRTSQEAGEAYFKSTIVFGALPDDKLPPVTTSNAGVRAWLQGRLPRLMEIFRADVDKLDPTLWPAPAPGQAE